MTDVRCPMCGKPNPEEAEICEFCQARLKPLILSPEPSEGEPELPDWLQNLRSLEEPEAEQPDSEELPADNTDDWFASPEDKGNDEPLSAESSGEEAPVDWLTRLDQDHENEPATEEAPLSAAPEAEPAASEDIDSFTDWIASLKDEQPAEEQAASTAEEPGAEEAVTLLPDETLLMKPVEAASQDEEENFTDWLSRSEAEIPPPPIDWLESRENEEETVGAEESEAIEEPAEPAEPAVSGELPDWLTALTTEIPQDISKPIAEEDIIPPDSLEQVEDETPEPGEIEPASSVEAPEQVEELPDWLSQIDRTQESVAGSVPAFTMDADLPPLEPGELAALEEATAEALSMPDWISELSAEISEDASEGTAPFEEAPDLAQAKLPDWLEAMRPVEAVAPDTTFLDLSDDRMESAGPLAGLRGVLPGDLRAIEQRKPPTYTYKIPLTDEQQARLSMLEALVNSEGQGQPVPARKSSTNQLVLRLAVFALLVLVSVAALWLSPQTPYPTTEQIAPEVLAAGQQVNALVPNRPVLFAIDYEPGFSDEMSTVVMPVLEHLASRGVHLAFVSTSPTGPILAGSLVAWVNRQPAYASQEFTNYTNLGFLPGGAYGIRAFAQAPAQTLPSKLDGSPAWDGPLANAQQGLDQFGMVVIASDDPEGARQWIEQAGPLVKDKTPLVLLTSAQAGPVLQPYYAPRTGLLSGLVSGMAGGADYYSATARAGRVPLYWGAFSLALNGVVLFIVLGGFVSLVSSSITQRKTQKGEEKT